MWLPHLRPVHPRDQAASNPHPPPSTLYQRSAEDITHRELRSQPSAEPRVSALHTYLRTPPHRRYPHQRSLRLHRTLLYDWHILLPERQCHALGGSVGPAACPHQGCLHAGLHPESGHSGHQPTPSAARQARWRTGRDSFRKTPSNFHPEAEIEAAEIRGLRHGGGGHDASNASTWRAARR